MFGVVANFWVLETRVGVTRGLYWFQQLLHRDLWLLQDCIRTRLVQFVVRQDHLGRVRRVRAHSLLLLLVQALQVRVVLVDRVPNTVRRLRRKLQ